MFAAFCAINDQQASDKSGLIDIYPSTEQYCRKGEVVQFADGNLIRDLKCESMSMDVNSVNEN